MAGTVVDTMLSDVADASTVGVGSGSPVRGGTLNVGLSSDVSNYYTFTGSTGKLDAAGFCVALAVYDPLFATSADGKTILPNLGTSITDTSGGGDSTEWTVQLRSGITFHDGSPFNADAVVANYNAAVANATVGAAISPFISSCTKSGNLTVVYELKIPFFNFPYLLAESQIAYMANPLMFTSKLAPNGTGPFKFKSWSPGIESQFTANASYWRKDSSGNALPYLAGINFHTQPDPASRLSSLKAGSYQVAVFFDGTSVKSIQKGVTSGDKPVAFISSQGSVFQPDTNCLMCNTNSFGTVPSGSFPHGTGVQTAKGGWTFGPPSPIADIRIRQALADAISASGYLSGLDQGQGAVANGIFAHGSPYWSATAYPVGGTSAKITAAKALVKAYNTANGHAATAKVTIHVQTIKSSTTSAAEFAYVAKAAAKVGITLVAVPMVQSTLILNAVWGTYEMTQWSQFGGVVPDGNYVWFNSSKKADGSTAPGFSGLQGTTWGGVNFAHNIDGTIESAMLTALAATTTAAQITQWQTVNQRFAIDLPYLFLDQTYILYTATSKVQNWANAHAPTAGSANSVTPVLDPAGGVMSWAEIWLTS